MVMYWSKPRLALLVFSILMAGAGPEGFAAEVDQVAAPPAAPAASAAAKTAPQAGQPSERALEQIVAPIAIYPDRLIAQVLTAATNPTEIVEADRWMQQASSLDAVALGAAVDQQAWGPSVKALTQFPPILANMDQNLDWTAALGSAYASQPQALLNAIQVLRRRAEQAGTLKSTPEETVTTDGETVVIEPASPGFVYLPEYNPWLVYGQPIEAYPDWDPYPGLFLDAPGDLFNLGAGIGVFDGFAWGWNHWRPDWHGGRMIYHNTPYIAHRPQFTGGHNPYGGHTGFAFDNGGFHAISPHVGMGFRPDGIRGLGPAGAMRSYSFRGEIGGGIPGGGFHGGAGFHGGSGFQGGGGGGRR
jgi:uncharacterized membrane protein YgcG